MTIKEIKQLLAHAQDEYNACVEAARPFFEAEAAASDAIKALRKDLSATITEGAKPCPRCKTAPIGIEQPRPDGGFEYEVGCPACAPFEHDDGTTREARVRGGLLPSHAVDAWNAGPDFWKVRK